MTDVLPSDQEDRPTLALEVPARAGLEKTAEASRKVDRWHQELQFFVSDGHSGRVDCLAFSPDNRFLASGANDHTVRIWDVSNGRLLNTLTHDFPVECVAFSPNGLTLASASLDETVYLWDAKSGNQRAAWRQRGAIGALAFSPDGLQLAVGCDHAEVHLLDASSGRLDRSMNSGDAELANVVSFLVYNQEGSSLASAAHHEDEVYLWDVTTGDLRARLRHGTSLLGITFATDGVRLDNRLLTVSAGGLVRVWSTRSNSLLTSMDHQWGRLFLRGAAFSPNGLLLAGNPSIGGLVGILDVLSGQLLVAPEYKVAAQSVVFSPDGIKLATGENKGAVQLWDAGTGRLLRFLKPADPVQAVDFGPQEDVLASGSLQGLVRIWNLNTGGLVRVLRHGGAVHAVAFSANGSTLASYSDERDQAPVCVWDTVSGDLLPAVRDENSHSRRRSRIRNNTRLEWDDDTISAWDITSGKELLSLANPWIWDEVRAMTLHPDGSRLAVASIEGLFLYEVRAEEEGLANRSRIQYPDPRGVNDVTFSSDGSLLVTASRDGSVRLWSVSNGEFVAGCLGLDGDDWITYTNDGYFIGSPDVVQRVLLRFHTAEGEVPYDLFARDNPNPVKVAEALARARAGQPVRPPRHASPAIPRISTPPPQLTDGNWPAGETRSQGNT